MKKATESRVRVVFKQSNVARKIPKTLIGREEIGLHFVPKGTDGCPYDYYHMGLPVKTIGKTRVLNVHFVGVTSEDLGKTRNFNVEIWEKTVGKEKYTGLTLTKIDGRPVYDLKISLDRPVSGGFQIFGTLGSIVFETREERVKKEAA